MEGATGWEFFWKITFPMISPMILVSAVYTVIDSFTSESNQVMAYINKTYSEANGNTKSAAMAWMYFGIIILIVGTQGLLDHILDQQEHEHLVFRQVKLGGELLHLVKGADTDQIRLLE